LARSADDVWGVLEARGFVRSGVRDGATRGHGDASDLGTEGARDGLEAHAPERQAPSAG
jgi:hypothetical protein